MHRIEKLMWTISIGPAGTERTTQNIIITSLTTLCQISGKSDDEWAELLNCG